MTLQILCNNYTNIDTNNDANHYYNFRPLLLLLLLPRLSNFDAVSTPLDVIGSGLYESDLYFTVTRYRNPFFRVFRRFFDFELYAQSISPILTPDSESTSNSTSKTYFFDFPSHLFGGVAAL